MTAATNQCIAAAAMRVPLFMSMSSGGLHTFLHICIALIPGRARPLAQQVGQMQSQNQLSYLTTPKAVRAR